MTLAVVGKRRKRAMARSSIRNQESGGSVNFPDAEDDRYDFLFKVYNQIIIPHNLSVNI